MVGGIYQIENTVTGARYIGRTVNLVRRQAEHLAELRSGWHYNTKLQRSFSKHGENVFRFKLLVSVRNENLRRALEQTWLDHAPGAYNLSRSADTPTKAGSKLSPQHKRRLAAILTARNKSPEHRARISAVLRGPRPQCVGRKRPAEWRAKLAKACEKARAVQAAKRRADPGYAIRGTAAARSALAVKQAAFRDRRLREMRVLREQGLSQSAIAKLLGTSQARVSKTLLWGAQRCSVV